LTLPTSPIRACAQSLQTRARRLSAVGAAAPVVDLGASGVLGLALRPGVARGQGGAAEVWAKDAEKHLLVRRSKLLAARVTSVMQNGFDEGVTHFQQAPPGRASA
jgi:hypothetical protein